MNISLFYEYTQFFLVMYSMYFIYVLIVLEDVSSQTAQNIGVLYVSGMYVASAVRFVSYVEQISEKKFFSQKKLSRSSFIYLITQNILSFSNFPTIRLTFPTN